MTVATPAWATELWAWIKKKFSELTAQVLVHYFFIILSVLIVVITPAILADRYTKNAARSLVEEIDPAPVACSIIPSESDNLRKQIERQRAEIIRRANNHRVVAVFFFGKFYATVLAFSVAVAIASITLAAVTRIGLDQAKPALLLIFFVATALAVFYQSFSGVFQQSRNIDRNRNLIVSYLNLKEIVDTYCVTGQIVVEDPAEVIVKLKNLPKSEDTTNNAVGKAKKETPVETTRPSFTVELDPELFINYVQYQMNALNSIEIGLDDTKAFDDAGLANSLKLDPS